MQIPISSTISHDFFSIYVIGVKHPIISVSSFVYVLILFPESSSPIYAKHLFVRSLIAVSYSKGEVEQIALMKPKAQTEHEEGMLEYLEDIIGSSCFKEPIELLEKRVEELNDCRGEKV